ncbi:MAG: hypothetical protein ACXADY_04025 [Candidatus Hodarchaeales archaeon]|jgi:hypothetical protein
MKQRRYRTKDGDIVKSRAEVIVDDALVDLKITHEYEKEIRLGDKIYKPDWYLPDYDLFIEYWGMEDNRSYQVYQREKQKTYGEYNIPYLSLADKDLEDRFALEERILAFINRYQGNKIVKEKVGIFELVKLGRLPWMIFLFPLLYSFISGVIGILLIGLQEVVFIRLIAEPLLEKDGPLSLLLLFPGYVVCFILGKFIENELYYLEIEKSTIHTWRLVAFIGLIFFIVYFIIVMIFRPLYNNELPQALVSFIIQPFGAWLLGGFYIIKYLVSD